MKEKFYYVIMAYEVDTNASYPVCVGDADDEEIVKSECQRLNAEEDEETNVTYSYIYVEGVKKIAPL